VCCLHHHYHHHHHSIRSSGSGNDSGNDGDVMSKLDLILMTCVECHSHFDIIGIIYLSYISQWLYITADLLS
jgi:hypothetical protein